MKKEKSSKRVKAQTLLSGTEEGHSWYISVVVYEDGTFFNRGSGFYFRNHKEKRDKDKFKIKIRANDRYWVIRHIPLSIWEKKQMHHDWNNGGRLYLLTRNEHILRHRGDKKNEQEK